MTRLFGPRTILPAALVAVALTAAAGCQPQGGISASASSSASLSATHSPKPHHSQTLGPDGARYHTDVGHADTWYSDARRPGDGHAGAW